MIEQGCQAGGLQAQEGPAGSVLVNLHHVQGPARPMQMIGQVPALPGIGNVIEQNVDATAAQALVAGAVDGEDRHAWGDMAQGRTLAVQLLEVGQ